MGDTTPTLPAPVQQAADKGCGALGAIILIAVAVVVTVYTGGSGAVTSITAASAAGVAVGYGSLTQALYRVRKARLSSSTGISPTSTSASEGRAASPRRSSLAS